jgi:hypothetical protein
VTIWLLPLGVAAAGALVVLVAARRAIRQAIPTTRSIARVRHELTPLIASLRREMSRAAGRVRAGVERDRR